MAAVYANAAHEAIRISTAQRPRGLAAAGHAQTEERWGYAPAARVLAVADELRRRAIPADGLWLDIQHMRGFRSFTFDPEAFPDPGKLVADLLGRGFMR